MLNLVCDIKIQSKDKKISFDYVHHIEIKTSRKNLTDTAVVKVPKKMDWKGRPLTDFITRGDSISVSAGYAEDGMRELFKGFVVSVENGSPLVIRCENEMWTFKTVTVPPEKIEKFDLKAYIEKYGGVKASVAEGLSFGSMDITEEMTLAQALDRIMQAYPYTLGYFQDGEFYAALNTKGWEKSATPVVFDPNRNMISDSLKYVTGDSERMGVKAVSILRDNSQLVAVSPAAAFDAQKNIKPGWSQRQEFCPQCVTQQEVQDYADRRAASWTEDRIEGSFTAFGLPQVCKGDVVELRDAERKERDRKRFMVDAVDFAFGTSGFRQTVTLGYQIHY
jgi:hypothetical protein